MIQQQALGLNSQTILGKSSENFHTNDNLMTTSDFTGHLWQS